MPNDRVKEDATLSQEGQEARGGVALRGDRPAARDAKAQIMYG